jgi:hypothetical protein
VGSSGGLQAPSITLKRLLDSGRTHPGPSVCNALGWISPLIIQPRMPSLHPFTVHILNSATGEPLEEHKVSQIGNRLECYIESTVGTEFYIAVQLADNFRDVHPCFKIYPKVDGTHINDRLMGALDQRKLVKSTKLQGVYLGNRQWRRMKFANTQFAGRLPFPAEP